MIANDWKAVHNSVAAARKGQNSAALATFVAEDIVAAFEFLGFYAAEPVAFAIDAGLPGSGFA